MNRKLQERYKQYKAIPFKSKILTNSMTIAAWKLFASDYRLHFGFILYRLRYDFGFSRWEIANFTGIPVRVLDRLMASTRNILRSDVLKIIVNANIDEEIDHWNLMPNTDNFPQSMVELTPWFEKVTKSERYKIYKDFNPNDYYGEKTANMFRDIINKEKHGQTKG